MTFKLQAREAAHLARQLTDDELFLLLASEGMKKGRQIRAFHEDNLRKPSVEKHLHPPVNLRDLLKSLTNKGFLNKRGLKMYEATATGNLVKHAFDDLRDSLILDAADPLSKSDRDWIPVLRARMDEIAKEVQ